MYACWERVGFLLSQRMGNYTDHSSIFGDSRSFVCMKSSSSNKGINATVEAEINAQSSVLYSLPPLLFLIAKPITLGGKYFMANSAGYSCRIKMWMLVVYVLAFAGICRCHPVVGSYENSEIILLHHQQKQFGHSPGALKFRSTATSNVPSTEMQALWELYNATNGHEWD